MASQETKVVIAASAFSAAIHITMCENLKKMFKLDEMTLRSLSGDAKTQKERLKQILVQTKPSALIGLDIKPDPEVVSAYTEAQVPIIVTNEEAPGVTTIAVDNAGGGRIAGEYLIRLGRKRIGIVSGRTHVEGGSNAIQRLKGFQTALNAAKLSIPQGAIVEVVDYSREDGIHVMPKLMSIGVDAIFCAAGDKCAQGLIAVAKDKGIRIPEDIAIIGFDDLLIAKLSTPALTTIRQPLNEMAEAAYKLSVFERDTILHHPKKSIFIPELIVRKSA